jgi:hypothetical protein
VESQEREHTPKVARARSSQSAATGLRPVAQAFARAAFAYPEASDAQSFQKPWNLSGESSV